MKTILLLLFVTTIYLVVSKPAEVDDDSQEEQLKADDSNAGSSNSDGSNLWDLSVKQENIIATVNYRGRMLSVWKQDVKNENYSRFYVTPLCVFDVKTLVCDTNAYTTGHQWIFRFNIKLWDNDAAEAVQAALKDNNIVAKASNIFTLPMQKVRVGIDRPSKIIKQDDDWRPNQDQRWILPFELYPTTNKICRKMLQDAREDADKFLNDLKLNLEFSMSASQLATRNITLSGHFLTKSKMFNTLKNQNKDDGVVYLNSKDVNKLAHDIVNQATYQEEVSSDYVPADKEDEVVSTLLNLFKKDKIQSLKLSKQKWDSVFWSDIFTRPDVQTDYFKQVLKYDKKAKNFKYDKEAERAFREKTIKQHTDSHTTGGGAGFSFEGFGISAEGSETKAHSDATGQDHGKKTIDILKFDDVQNSLKKDNVNVRWKGRKFEQKNIDLYRMNTRELSSKSTIFFLRTTVTKQKAIQKIYAYAEKYVPTTSSTTTTTTTTTTTPSTTTTTMTTPLTTTTTTITTTVTTTITPEAFRNLYSTVTFWEDPYYKGKKKFFYADRYCKNMDADFRNKASSVSYHGRCMQVYEQEDCKGEPAIITLRDYQDHCNRQHFDTCGMDDKISSFKVCEPSLYQKMEERVIKSF